MRVALCFSGQPRYIDGPQSASIRRIVELYGCDVFCHYWLQNEREFMETAQFKVPVELHVEEKLQMYNPKVIVGEEPLPKSVVTRDYYRPLMKPYGLKSMYTSLKRSFEIMEDYAAANGITYDVVVRMRYDAFVVFPDLHSLDLSKVHWPLYEKLSTRRVINATWFGPPHLVKPLFNTLKFLDKYNDQGVPFCDEDLMYASLEANRVLEQTEFHPRRVFSTHNIYRGGQKSPENQRPKILFILFLIIYLLCAIQFI